MSKLYTDFPIVNYLLGELLSGLQSILKENLIGVYVYGSLVWGDFDEGCSDIDVFVALSQEMSLQEFGSLEALHHKLAKDFPAWNDRIEVAYASYNLLQHFKTETGKIAVISPGEPFNIKSAGTDWLINYYLLQRKSLNLFGPSPMQIIAPVSNSEFVTNVKKQAIEWQDWVIHTRESLGFQYYAVLTLCRALYVLHHQEQPSKLKAGIWAKNQFQKWQELIQRALTKAGLTDANQALIEENYQEVTAFVDDIVQHIKKMGMSMSVNELKMIKTTTKHEWDVACHFRQFYFFDKAGLSDPYTWTFEHDSHVHFVLYHGSDIIGYTHLQLWPKDRAALRIIVIDEEKRNHQYGSQFLSLCENWLKNQGYHSLHVESSPAALKFYRNNGYIDMPFEDPDGYEGDVRDTPVGKVLS